MASTVPTGPLPTAPRAGYPHLHELGTPFANHVVRIFLKKNNKITPHLVDEFVDRVVVSVDSNQVVMPFVQELDVTNPRSAALRAMTSVVYVNTY